MTKLDDITWHNKVISTHYCLCHESWTEAIWGKYLWAFWRNYSEFRLKEPAEFKEVPRKFWRCWVIFIPETCWKLPPMNGLWLILCLLNIKDVCHVDVLSNGRNINWHFPPKEQIRRNSVNVFAKVVSSYWRIL
jgi:hypothetical protein